MAVHIFGAIDIGSYVTEMKVFSLSRKGGIKQIDDIRHIVDLGGDAYRTGLLSDVRYRELIRILKDFRKILNGYGAEALTACGTSAFRQMKNVSIPLVQIEQQTGVHIEVLGNAAQRFLDYKSLAYKGADFNRLLEEPTAIVDIGGEGVQISLFEKDRLIATQNLRLGLIMVHEQLAEIGASQAREESIIEEIVGAQLSIFKKLYQKDVGIRNIIVVDDYISDVARSQAGSATDSGEDAFAGIKKENGFIRVADFNLFIEKTKEYSASELSRLLGVDYNNLPYLKISSIMMRSIARVMKADMMWVPGVTLCDGIAYDYALQHHFITPAHDFERDILACVMQISKRYKGSEVRGKTLESICLQIFDRMKKIHGLGDRERLLLRISARLHDCGKYISMQQLSECSYGIIMATEIIGLTRREREIVANVVRFNHTPFVYYEELRFGSSLSMEDYDIMTRLCAILRLANGLDRSHKQKFTDIRIRLIDNELQINVSTKKDITLEKGLFRDRAEFFEQIYHVRPVIRQKGE